MKKVIIQLYYIKYIELCCAYCLYMNLHKSHKIIPINDEETLKKENISINEYIKDLDLCYQNVINIKNKIILVVLMKNLKLNFVEDNIKYEEYYFNGLSIPKDIQINDIKSNEFKISWKLDDLNILNIDKNQLNYKVEIRKDKEQFKCVYEGNNLKFKI